MLQAVTGHAASIAICFAKKRIFTFRQISTQAPAHSLPCRPTSCMGLTWVVLKIMGPLFHRPYCGTEGLGVPKWDPNFEN